MDCKSVLKFLPFLHLLPYKSSHVTRGFFAVAEADLLNISTSCFRFGGKGPLDKGRRAGLDVRCC